MRTVEAMSIDEEHNTAIGQPAVNPHITTIAAADNVHLPAQDGGKRAWLFLAGAAVIEIVAWGGQIP